jgi:hypothetical protein
MKKIIAISIFAAFAIFAAPPPDVPGELISDEAYFIHSTKDAPLSKVEESGESSKNAKNGINTVPIYEQIAKDTTTIQYGKGAVFVQRMSEEGNIEPNFYIYDDKNERIEVGETGKKINLSPGRYRLEIIDKTPFNLKRNFEIIEAKITPVIPNWSAARIEVVDENGVPIRGNYELANLDPLTSVGRGNGRDINLAQELQIWYLPVGYYKIFGVGSTLNAIDNFLTFRIVQNGEYLKLTVVQDSTERILGGGTLLEDIMYEKKRSNWSHSINVGGSMDFNYYSDDLVDTVSNITNFSLLIYDRLHYKKNKLEFTNLIKLDAGLLIEGFDFTTLRATTDELRVNSLFTYRLFPRIGPYWRGEFISSFLTRTAKFSAESIKNENARNFFIFYDKVPDIIGDDDEIRIDSVSASFRTLPILSPIQLQAGGGVNIQIFKNQILDLRFLNGLGVEYEKQWDAWKTVSENGLKFDETSDIYKTVYSSKDIERIILERSDAQRFDFGPEFILSYFMYLTKYMTIDGELRLFMPFERFYSPDFRTHTLVSLRLTQYMSLDYDYTFNLVKASQEELQTKSNKHRILARFSFARR